MEVSERALEALKYDSRRNAEAVDKLAQIEPERRREALEVISRLLGLLVRQ